MQAQNDPTVDGTAPAAKPVDPMQNVSTLLAEFRSAHFNHDRLIDLVKDIDDGIKITALGMIEKDCRNGTICVPNKKISDVVIEYGIDEASDPTVAFAAIRALDALKISPQTLTPKQRAAVEGQLVSITYGYRALVANDPHDSVIAARWLREINPALLTEVIPRVRFDVREHNQVNYHRRKIAIELYGELGSILRAVPSELMMRTDLKSNYAPLLHNAEGAATTEAIGCLALRAIAKIGIKSPQLERDTEDKIRYISSRHHRSDLQAVGAAAFASSIALGNSTFAIEKLFSLISPSDILKQEEPKKPPVMLMPRNIPQSLRRALQVEQEPLSPLAKKILNAMTAVAEYSARGVVPFQEAIEESSGDKKLALLRLAGGLRKVGAPLAPLVIEALDTAENSRMQCLYIDVLGGIAAPEKLVVEKLAPFLLSNDVTLIAAAARALANVGPEAKEVEASLALCLLSDDEAVRKAARSALKNIGEVESSEDELTSDDNFSEFRLGFIGSSTIQKSAAAS